MLKIARVKRRTGTSRLPLPEVIMASSRKNSAKRSLTVAACPRTVTQMGETPKTAVAEADTARDASHARYRR